jgi:hypothetical protein
MKYKKGMGVIEVLIGATIITVGVLALITAFNTYLKYALSNDKNAQAAYLGEETLESLGFLRDGSWKGNIKNLSTTTTYYLAWNVTKSWWQPTTTPQYVDGIFLRSFTLTDVFRDGNGKIASTGTFDPSAKFITVSLSFFQGHSTSTKTMATYLTDLYQN